jgi:ADP-dependent NAD(P)H-hydrate dehydratase
MNPMRPSPRVERLDETALRAHPMPRDERDDKLTRGTVAVVGGSVATPGAIVLAGRAALRIGTGRLQVVTDERLTSSIAVAVPESMVLPFSAAGEVLADADAVVVGPGLRERVVAAALLDAVLSQASQRAVIVVDALALAAARDLVDALRPRAGQLVFTPNRSELVGLALSEDDEDETERVDGDIEREVALRYGASVISFGCVADPDGTVWLDPVSVSGLGTSGAGDVLAGLAGGAGARSGRASAAAMWAALIHRRAAVRIARSAPTGYLASDLVEAVPATLAAVGRSRLQR